jgi:hypothetical protein
VQVQVQVQVQVSPNCTVWCSEVWSKVFA